MMEVTGQLCKTVIDNEPYEFFGVLDIESELVQDDRGVQWVQHMYRLTVKRDIATRIPRDVLHTITTEGETYTVRYILFRGDGENCEIYLTKINPYTNECNTPEGC